MADFSEYFSIQIFFIILRETLETAIIISILLSFINQRSESEGSDEEIEGTEYDDQRAKEQELKLKPLRLQIWMGAISGFLFCMVIGVVFIGFFYLVGKDYWSYTERIWEGVFSLLSSIIITIVGVGLLRINKVLKVKWWVKLGEAYHNDGDLTGAKDLDIYDAGMGRDSVDRANQAQDGREGEHSKVSFSKKYFLAILPFVTTLREGLEAVVLVGGIGMSQPVTSLPLSILAGALFGTLIGLILYKGGNKLSLQYFLIFLTCFLYIVSAGLMSRGVWFLELERYVRLCGGLDVSETGSGPGSYDISNSVWHVNCCNGLTDGWWMVFNAIFGWTNSATYGSVTSYCLYWLVVIAWLKVRLYEEKEGVLPFVPLRWQIKRIRKKVKIFEARLADLPAANSSDSAGDRSVHSVPNTAPLHEDAEAEALLATAS